MSKKRNAKYILMLVGLLIFLAGYFLLYMDFANRTDKLTAESRDLSDRLNVLSGYSTRLEELENGIETNKTAIGEELSRYKGIETPEDFIMMAKAMEDDIGVSITALSFEEPFFIADITAVEEDADYLQPVETRTLTGYGITAVMDASVTYKELKESLRYIGRRAEAVSLDSIDISYDSTTGEIIGSLVIDKFYITGRDIEQEQTYVPYTDIGNDALIGG